MKKNSKKKGTVDYNWIIKIVVSSFLISVIFTLISETVIPNVGIIMGSILTLILILVKDVKVNNYVNTLKNSSSLFGNSIDSKKALLFTIMIAAMKLKDTYFLERSYDQAR